MRVNRWAVGGACLACVIAFGTTGDVALAQAPRFAKVLTFTGEADGARPAAAPIQVSDGTFYGTTAGGGAGFGTIFRMDASGTLTTLHVFSGGPDGADPYAGLIQAPDGAFYGTTEAGGADGYGTVFRMDAKGTLTVLHSFTGGADGANPYAGLIQAGDGTFYGTTVNGGDGFGTVYKMDASGTLTTLHAFSGGADGAKPYTGLIQARNGLFYGTTAYGGRGDGGEPYAGLMRTRNGRFDRTTSQGGGGFGTVFQMDANGTLTTLHLFNGADGMLPAASLLQAGDGTLYGTTVNGGLGFGTVYKVDASGTLTTLHAFSGGADGANPFARLLQAGDNTFYGTTNAGGAHGAGSVFQMDARGAITTLHAFHGTPDGAYPNTAGLIHAGDGSIYGATLSGGASGVGVIFRLAGSPAAR